MPQVELNELIGQVAGKAAAEAVKAISATNANMGHGPGLFSQPMDPNVVNAMQLPIQGLAADLPEQMTQLETPLYGIITGQTAGSGSTPADACSPWGVAGYTQLCRQMATLGTMGISSDPLDLTRLGRYTDRSDFRDYRLVGDPFSTAYDNAPSFPGSISSINPNDFMNYEFAKKMRELEVEFIRRFAPDVYSSNPSNANDAFHRAWFRGLDMLINTGYQDAVTGTACAKADSMVVDFQNYNITTSTTNIVDLVAETMYVLKRVAAETGLDPVVWKFVMTPELFRELTAVWPCSYLTNRCLAASSSNPNVVVASEQVKMREEMRSGKFLWVDAEQIPVVLDTAAPQTQVSAGVFRSDLRIVPYTVRGGFPVTFKTFFDFNAPGAAGSVISAMGMMANQYATSPDGKFLFTLEKTWNCFQLGATARPGLVLRTPFLAARITNIKYQPRLVTPSWNPSAPSFYAAGGTTSGTGPSYYNPTTAG